MNKYDLLLHVDKPDGSINIAFSNAVNYAAALPEEEFNMVLVVNSKAVTQLVRDHADLNREKMRQAAKSGLSIKVCRNALKDNNVSPEALCEECEVVPAGIVEIVDKQRLGYAYVKP